MRPAVAVYGELAAVALRGHPEAAWPLRDGEPGYVALFCAEVRRFYPFFPAIVARASRDFEWRGHHIPKGRRAMLDLYGTNDDTRIWCDPEAFRPERLRR